MANAAFFGEKRKQTQRFEDRIDIDEGKFENKILIWSMWQAAPVFLTYTSQGIL